ncbi:uncharacterized protein LOC109831471 [Asparagus officinalis]|uniref:uncharacterized protein LOC109831471 n=1 Tax=Asparagus officinalis TaxID=4686 RepID=UPI00098E7E44|nr:uncharacterized protein LOC109831471 [Asparagus officinalis]
MTWLLNSMKAQISSSVMFLTTAKEMWDILKIMYGNEKNVSRVFEIYERLFALKQGDKSVSEFFGELKGLIGELEMHQPVVADAARLLGYRRGLTVSTGVISDTIAPSQPTMDQSAMFSDQGIVVMAMIQGEDVAPLVGGQTDYERLRQLELSQNIHSATHASSSGMNAYIASSHKSWVLDCGASSHMTGIKNHFVSLHLSDKFPSIRIADSTLSPVRGVGVVHATSSLKLTDVLYVPKFSDLATGMKIGSGHERGGCESCELGKHHSATFQNRVDKRSSFAFELVHSDVWGPYRVPSVKAGLIVGNIDETIAVRDIIVYDRKMGLSRISDLHPSLMAMQYPLLFPYGEDGFRLGVPLEGESENSNKKRKDVTMMEYAAFMEGESENSNKKRKDVTMMEYAAFKIQQRCDEGHTLILSGKLFQTYIVDMFTCIEEDRLLWVRLNQTKLRAELYCGIKDAIFRGDTDGAQVGKRIILPSSFTGGNRYMTQNYQDAIALCRVLGNPDLFITITSNPKWQEIKYALDEIGGQRPDERPDIVARVFKIKLDLLMEDLQAGQYFGNSIADERLDIVARVFKIKFDLLMEDLQAGQYFGNNIAAAVYTVEFQKRGLSHAHILLWLHPNSKYPDSNDINKIISAEIPDRETDPVGYAAVGQYMMHGPCGIFNTSSPCMRKGNCSKHFPKKYVNETVIDESGFAVYRRRNDNNRWVDKNGTKLDNAYVVPYNRNLIVKYQSHINVEWCNRGRSIKYLFKYITKGPDHASISLRSHKSSSSGSNNHEKTDEIQYYLDCRYISAPEAIWRIYGFDIHYRVPAVERLPFHLPDQQSMIFKDSDDLNEIIDNIHAKKSKFISWMEANKLYDESKTLTYSEFPSHFVWLADEKRWKIREKGRSIGRVFYSHPTSGERFYLRLLLNVVKGPTSFDDIKTKDGIVYPTFKEACQAWRLLNDDQEWQYVLDEASYVASGKQFRQLFAKLLLFCEVVNPQILWENNWKYMAEGILEDQRNILDMPTLTMSEQELQSYTLAEIQYLLLENGRSLKNFKGMPLPDLQIMQQCKHKIISEELNFNRDELRCENEKFIQGMNTDQKVIYDTILGSVYKEQGGLFFIYGHGGTGKTYLWKSIILNSGKTYLWKSIISKLRSEGKIVLPVASLGIASILLPKGRTAHSRFNIPIILKNNSTCGIKIGSPEAELIKMTSLIIWDEAPMVHKHAFEAVDRTFKDILGAECSENVNKPFGGKTFVLGGDFRQILPVIPKGSKHDILHASISCSYLWRDCKVLTLTKNMRLQTQVNESTTMSTSDFSKWVLDIGNGDNMCKKNAFHDQDFLVQIPDNFIIHANGNPIDAVISFTYPRLMQNYSNEEYLEERAILTARNEVVDIINNEILDIVPGEYVTYLSSDSLCPTSPNLASNEILYPTEFLNSQKFPGMPNHEIKLKVGTPIMLLRNLSPADGLCNAISRVTSPQGLKILIENEDGIDNNVTENVVYKEVFNNLTAVDHH